MKYWGLYCPQHDGWLCERSGILIYYPAAAIAHAHLDTIRDKLNHLYEVTEYGTEQKVDVKSLPAGSKVCPVTYYEDLNLNLN